MMENEAFWNSVNSTQFKTLPGELICSAGDVWPKPEKIGIVTAWNPYFKQAPDVQNVLRNEELKRELVSLGLAFEEINAWWPDGQGFEHSFVIRNLTQEAASRLCVKYGQAAYFYARSGEAIGVVMVEAE